jgi:transketolase
VPTQSGEAVVNSLNIKANWVWQETLKLHRRAPETRIASSLSPIEIFVALYYGGYLKQNPKDPFWMDRDRCIISKGHGSLCMYPILADLGYFPVEELENVCQEGSFLGGIPDPIIPGYETINGSLGHGCGVATGIALALKRQRKPQKVYVVTGDGELGEGSNWEAFMFAAHQKLDNLVVIVDNNKYSMLGATADVVSLGSLDEKFAAFGWQTFEAVDGNNVDDICQSLDACNDDRSGRPKVIIANTRKGRGVPSLEGNDLCHVMGVNAATIDKLLLQS